MKQLIHVHLFASLLLLAGLGAARSQAEEIAPLGAAAAQGTGITYQGRLNEGGSPANGEYDFQFRLYDSTNGAGQVGSTVTKSSVSVSRGLFTVDLDFGTGAFTGDARWLRIDVRPSGVGASYTTLTPRQAVAAVPYALHALSVAEHDHWGETWTGLSGTDGLRVEHGATSGETYGVVGVVSSTLGTGLLGRATAGMGLTAGVIGESASGQGAGVYGHNAATSGDAIGLWGRSDSFAGRGVYGVASELSGATFGVYGESNSFNGRGVYGTATATSGWTQGVFGRSDSIYGAGVLGTANATSGPTFGVYGWSDSTSGTGIYGYAASYTGTNTGVEGWTNSPTGYAGYFTGRVHVAGTLSKSAGAFKIDHPLDPANRYLSHSFVESPDMKNMYDGLAVLSANGAATVTLPVWFEALNRDFRYQLTPIGAAMPDLHVAQEIKANAFRIAGGKPGMKVSWQVTGIRHDPYAEANRIAVEEPKPADEQGTYLYPQGYGRPLSASRDYQRHAGREAAPDYPP